MVTPTIPYIFWSILFSILVGVGGSIYFDLLISKSVVYTLITVGASLLLVSLYFKHGVLLIVSVCVLFFSVGSLRTYAESPQHDLETRVGQVVEFEGLVVDDLEDRDESKRFRVWVEEWREYILIIDFTTNRKVYGDYIAISGKITKPESFVTDTGRVFEYEKFLLKDSVRYIVRTHDLELLEKNRGNFVKGALLKFKHRFVSNIQKILPSPESSLLVGLLLGVKSSLGTSLLELFRASGLIHIVVLSGYNITLVIELVRRMTGFLGRNKQIFLSILFIIMFVIMVGADIPVLRASLMALVSLLALHFHREYLSLRALGLIFVCLVLWNPLSLLYDPSLHLSVLATAGIILLTPKLDAFFARLSMKDTLGIRGILAATLGTQVFVVPYLAFAIGEISIVSLLANVLAIPLVPFAMLFGFVVAMLEFVFSPLAQILSVIVYALLAAIVHIASFFGSLDFATIRVPEISIFILVISYVCIFFLAMKSKKENNNRVV